MDILTNLKGLRQGRTQSNEYIPARFNLLVSALVKKVPQEKKSQW